MFYTSRTTIVLLLVFIHEWLLLSNLSVDLLVLTSWIQKINTILCNLSISKIISSRKNTTMKTINTSKKESFEIER